MATIIDLTGTYERCLPKDLSQLLNQPGVSFSLGKKVSHQGKQWNVLVDVKSDATSTFIRAYSDEEFHIWSCSQHPSQEGKIQVSHFAGLQISDNTISYEAKGQQFSILLIEGKASGDEMPPKVSEKIAELAMPWIQKHGLQKHCHSLIGREFSPPTKEESIPSPPTHENRDYQKLFVWFVLGVVATYVIYKVANQLFARNVSDR